MKVHQPHTLPEDKQEKLQRLKKLEWITIGFMISIILVIYLTLGSSQAMKAAWAEDLLSLVPPVVFLATVGFRSKDPDEKFPYGYRRALLLAFLCAAVALTLMGGFLLYDSISKLITQEHPTVGTVNIFGWQVWQGWLMIAALTYSIIPPVILGRMKLPMAKELHEKVIYADADMNKADWLTGLAGILGILGIGMGWWWADAVAAGVISLDIFKDGLFNLKESVFDLMDRRPTKVGSAEPEAVTEQLRRKLEQLDWVKEADIRLREVGDTFSGEAYLVPKNGEVDLLEKVKEASRIADDYDWRIQDVVIMPVYSLSPEDTE